MSLSAAVLLKTFGPPLIAFIARCLLAKPGDLPKEALGFAEKLVSLWPKPAEPRTDAEVVQRAAEEVLRKLAARLVSPAPARDDLNLEAVLDALWDTLDRCPLRPEDLVERNLDAGRIGAHLLDAGKALERRLSEAERALYRDTLRDLAGELVRWAPRFQAFHALTAGEILDRHDALADALDRRSGDTAADAFERSYRKAAARKLDQLELFGIDVGREHRRYPLSLAYVRLSLTSAARASETLALAEEALAGATHVLIRGEAGSGKTTLLQWLAVRAAKGDFPEALTAWKGTVPFFIRLRQFVEAQADPSVTEREIRLPALEEFPSLVADKIAGSMPQPDWVHRQMEAGHALVLVDGVDEVPESLREQVRDWIIDLKESYGRCRIVVSARPYVEEDWLETAGFREYRIAPLTREDAVALVDQWHDALLSQEPEPEERKELERHRRDMKAELAHTGQIQRLASSPLLCAMLCALHHTRRGHLPTGRVGLYEACCDALLERREKERRIALEPHQSWLTLELKRLLTEELAFWMLRQGATEIPAGEADEFLERRLRRVPGRPEKLTGPEFRRFLVQRTGLLREPASGTLEFSHKTFLEFLAARAAVANQEIRFLVKNAEDDAYHEVLRLAAGLARGSGAQELIQGLLSAGDLLSARSPGRYRLHLLAAACVEACMDVDERLSGEVSRRLKKLIPPRDPSHIDGAVAAGELAVPFLAPNPAHDETIKRICVQVLTRIRTAAALDQLAAHALLPFPGLQELLEVAWPYFDQEEYARRVLAPLIAHLEEWDAPRLSHLDGVQHFTRLRHLRLRYAPDLTDLRPVAGLTNLQRLDLRDCDKVWDLQPLASLTNLQHLGLRGCEQVRDLQPLASLTNLLRLYLLDCPQVEDLQPLAALTDLQYLGLRGCEQVLESQPLTGLTNLRHLDLSDCPLEEALGPLRGRPGLHIIGRQDYILFRS